MHHELLTGEKYKLDVNHEESYGRSFWGGLGMSGQGGTEPDENEEVDLSKDRLDCLSKKGQNRGQELLEGLEGFKIILLQVCVQVCGTDGRRGGMG